MWGSNMTQQQRRGLWFGRVRDWRSSGLSMAEFCRRHDLKRPTLSAWIKRDLQSVVHESSDLIPPTAAPLPLVSPISRTQTAPVPTAAAKPSAHRIATPAACAALPALTLVATDWPLTAQPAPMCLLLPGGARLTLPLNISADWLTTLLRGLS